MARRGAGNQGMNELVKTIGEQIGAELGRVIAASLQRELESSVDLGAVGKRLGSGGGRSGRRAASDKSTCSEPGCGNPVLAKGLCRSHYYRERYQSQKGGGRGKRAGKAEAAGKKRRGRRPAKAAAESVAGPDDTATS